MEAEGIYVGYKYYETRYYDSIVIRIPERIPLPAQHSQTRGTIMRKCFMISDTVSAIWIIHSH